MLYSPFVAVLFVLFSLPAMAGPSDHERELFQQLYVDAQYGRVDQQDFAPLQDYVLYPYLLAARLGYDVKYNQGSDTDRRIAAFLKRYPNVYRSDGLREAWLKSLAERQHWRSFLAHAPVDLDDTELECFKAQALINTHSENALAAASALWLAGHSQPDACNAVFAWLENSGNLSAELVNGRVQLAKEERERDLVAYLSRMQQGSAKHLTRHWLQLARHPQRSLRQLAQQRDRGLSSHDARLLFQMVARRDTEAAAAAWQGMIDHHNLYQKDAALAAAYLGYVLMLSRKSESEQWFIRAGKIVLDEKLSDWRLRSALLNQDWAAVVAWVELLPAAMRKEPRWRYWHARALLELGDASTRDEARDELAALAQGRGYYHYLAADKLGLDYAFNNHPVAIDKGLQKKLAANPVIRRAHELWKLDTGWQARAEWRQLNDLLDDDALRQAALMAHQWGWNSEAVLSMQAGDGWDDLPVRFPLAYKKHVAPISKMRRLDPAWVYGLMRQESLFMPKVRSAANAWGLMQLLPSTARRTAGKIGMRWRGVDGLQQPEYNVRLGTAYLKEMYDDFGDRQPLATAAYNAGPNAVERWLPDAPTEGALWVEIIPYNETFHYVHRVLENTVTFEWRLLGKAKRLTHRLGTVVPENQLP